MTSLLTLEEVFTDPTFFGVTTASAVQRAFCRCADGIALGDLAEDPTVINAFGGIEAVRALPVGLRPTNVNLYSGVRVGKSLIAAALAFRATQSVDVSTLRVGEVPRFTIVSLKLDTAAVVFGHVVGTILDRPFMKRLVVEEPTKDSILIRHPCGRPVEIKVVAGARSGGSVLARWSAGAVADEKPRMLGSEEDGVVNYFDLAAALEGRLLPGAQSVGIGSPWAPLGPAYEEIQSSLGHPTRHRVTMKAPAFDVNPSYWTAEKCTQLREANPTAYKTDCLGDFADGVASALPSSWVDACFRMAGPHDEMSEPIGILDSSAGSGDAFVWAVAQWCIGKKIPRFATYTVMEQGRPIQILKKNANDMPILEEQEEPKPFIRVFAFGSVDGKFRENLTFDRLVERIALDWQRRGVRKGVGDGFQAWPIQSAMSRFGIKYNAQTWSRTTKTDGLSRLKSLMRDRALVIEPGGDTKVRTELVQLQAKPAPTGGYSIAGRKGGHDDRAAIILNVAMLDDSAEFRGSPIQTRRTIEALT